MRTPNQTPTPPADPGPDPARRLLMIGDLADGAAIRDALDAVHAIHPIGALLVEQRTAADGHGAIWATHQRHEGRCRLVGWNGPAEIRDGGRPPVYGVDRLHAVLIEGRGCADHVLILGPYLALGPDGRRRPAWDVPLERVARKARALGWVGWWRHRGGHLRRLPGP